MKYAWLALVLGLAFVTGTEASDDTVGAGASTSPDPFLWLEETHGTKAMGWVTAQNAITTARYADSPAFEEMRKELLAVLDSEASIPWVSRRGEYLYNFWKDKQNPRGVWRRTTLADYRIEQPDWEVLLDIDALNRKEGESWVFHGAQCLPPEYERCLVSLSPGGGDATAVREFDISSKSFVEDGFVLPSAKSSVDWIDKNTIYVGTDFGPGSMTESSYPRIVKVWQRGTPLTAAATVYEAKVTDLSVSAWHDPTPGFERDFVYVAKDFYHHKIFLREEGELTRIEIPNDANMSAHRQWLLVETRSEWEIKDHSYPAGALLAIKFQDFLNGQRDFEVLFRPDPRSALASYNWTRHHLILNVLEDVQNRLTLLTPSADGWSRKPLAGAPELSTVRVVDTDPMRSDEYWLSVSGFLTPTTLKRGVIEESEAEALKHEPAFFDAGELTVSQHFTESRDGTRVPYFQVAPKGMKLDGSNITLLYGYGGFEVSLLPHYSGGIGRAWLEEGGVYVVANIRGGGEYGPDWHKAAIKANRPKAYQDFAAVARDLIERGVTSPEHLGAMGGSNGGLLVGNMLTDHPELFGAIACAVPLLDMKRYTKLAAGASWIAEYGNPEDPEQWAFMKAFSPYHNVNPATDYPPVLFYTATSDDRVGPHQARKMTARMQAMGHGDVWFYENTEGGHGAAAVNKQEAFMDALAYRFLWHHLR